MSHADSQTRFAVLLFSDIVGSTDLKARYGVPAYRAALQVHNDHFERLARECRVAILQNMGDGYFAEARSVADAVRFALLFQDAMRAGPWGEIPLTTRVGVHAGEVTTLMAEGGSGIVAPAADLAARVMSLAVGGQILLSRFPFDEARHFLREHPAVAGRATPPLRWLAHGPYLLKGRDEPMEIFEVGAEGFAPLTPPPDGEKAKRAIRPGEEETLGWRPAIGLEIPGRPGWRLMEKLGAGGFGEVWTGEHAKLRQRRAFKFCFDDERLRALKREVTLVRLLRTALGDRDDIVRFHELKLDEPPFYLESDLAPHGNLLQWAEKQGGLAAIPFTQRIALVAHTASALAAAHSIGVLHKDIKPTNILIFDAPDGTARPRLVDFGIGTLADPAVLGQHGVTAAGFTRATIEHSTGTPTYSPPEYLAGKPYTVQGDIYGLGVLLYQLLTADSSRPIAPGWERDIPDPLLREDIAACVDGDPARRLPSAADLAERLFHLDQRRAEIAEKARLTREAAARAESEAAAVANRLRVSRLRKVAGAFAVLALLAIAGGILAWGNQRKAEIARGEVVRKNAQIEDQNTEYRIMLSEVARAERLIADKFLLERKQRAAFAYLAQSAEHDPATALAAEMAGAALNVWQHPPPAQILAERETHPIVTDAQFSPDGTRIVTATMRGLARVWETGTGRILAVLTGHEEGTGISSIQFSADGTRVVTASWDNTARVWDSITGRALNTLVGHADVVKSARFSPDGTRIVTASHDHTARVWDTVTGKMLVTLAGHEHWVEHAQFNSAGTRILTVSTMDKTNAVRVWDAATGKALVTLAGHELGVWDAQFNSDGKRIVTASWDSTAKVWDATTGKTLVTLSGHEEQVRSARFSPDGARIVTASMDKTARVWDPATGKMPATLDGHEDGVRIAQFSPDGTRIITASSDKTARVWDAGTGKRLFTLAEHGDWVENAQFSPDGRRILTRAFGQPVRVWDATFEKGPTVLAGHDNIVRSAQFDATGTRIVTASEDKMARVWDASTGKILVMLTGHEKEVWSARFSPDGLRILTASFDQTARLWEAATGKLLNTFTGHGHRVTVAEFSPDGLRVVTGSNDRTARVWDAATARALVTLAGHDGWLTGARFSPDGTRIVTASFDLTARVWDASNGKELAKISGHDDELTGAQFSSDGTRILTTSFDKTARVWEANTGKELVTLHGHDDWVLSAQFSPDGARIVTGSADKTARVWNLLPSTAGPPPDWFPDFLRYMAQMRLNPDGELETLTAEDWLALRQKLRSVLRRSTGTNSPYLAILRRYVS